LVGSDPAPPPQAAIAKAIREASSDATVRSEVCSRKTAIPIPLNDTATFRGNPESDDLRGVANESGDVRRGTFQAG
jgi:hypothetical protein